MPAERSAPAALHGDRAFRGAGPDAPRRDRERQPRPAAHARVLGDRQSTGTVQRHETVKKAVLADAQRVGFEVVQADLADLRLDAAGRLLAADVPIDLVLLQWGSDRIVDDGGGLAALRSADRARTVELFPRTESALISSKAVLAWLHEDCDAGLLAAADQRIGAHPRSVDRMPGPGRRSGRAEETAAHRDRRASTGWSRSPPSASPETDVIFGSQTSEQDWPSAVVDAARESPVVLQQRVESDRMTMPFHDRDSGGQVTAQVPFVLSPFMIDGAAASVAVRHMGPGVPAGDVVIGAIRGACQSTALLAPEAATDRPTHRQEQLGVLSHQ